MKSQVMGRRTQDPWSRARSRRTPQRVSPAEPAPPAPACSDLAADLGRNWCCRSAGGGKHRAGRARPGRPAVTAGATEPGAPRPRPGSRRPVCGEQGRPVRGRSPSPKGALSPAEPREQPRPRPAHARWLPGSEAFLLAKGPDPGLRVAPSGTGKAHRSPRVPSLGPRLAPASLLPSVCRTGAPFEHAGPREAERAPPRCSGQSAGPVRRGCWRSHVRPHLVVYAFERIERLYFPELVSQIKCWKATASHNPSVRK